MNATNPYFDDRIADWLEDDPTVAPAQVLETVLAAVPSISQRRGPAAWLWRPLFPAERFGFARLALVVAALVLAALLGLAITGGPKPIPTAAPSPSPVFGLSGAVAPFTSPLYGYSVDRPVEWTVRAARDRLGEEAAPWINSTGVDYIAASPAASAPPGFIIAAVDLTAGRTLDDWTTATVVATCGAPASQEAIVVDGEPAILSEYVPCRGFHHLWATVIHQASAYHLVLISGRGGEAADRAEFDRVVASFRFPPVPSPLP